MILLFTDLDASLLDSETYSWEAAKPAIAKLRAEEVPWVFVTSKTRAEVEFWREETGNQHPYIVENGASLIVPEGYFPETLAGSRAVNRAEVLDWGVPYSKLVEALERASAKSRCQIKAFHQMTAEQVAVETNLPLEQCRLAKMREFDEPFIALDTERVGRLVQAIHEEGLHCVAGSRFLHITGDNDKGVATKALQQAYENWRGPMTTIGIGDSFNDVELLGNVSIPILMCSPSAEKLKRMVPNALVTNRPGPAGWNGAVLEVLASTVSRATV